MSSNPSHPDVSVQNKRGSFSCGTLRPQPRSPKRRHCHWILAVTAPSAGQRDAVSQVLTLPLKGHKGDWVPVSHTGPSEHILADADEWQELAGAQGRSPEAGRGSYTDHGWATEGSVQVPRVKADSLRTSAARARARRLPDAEHKVGSRRPRGLGTGHRARRGRSGHGLARGSDLTLDPDPTPGSAVRDHCAHSPLWLTQVGFRSFIVRPPPPPPPG